MPDYWIKISETEDEDIKNHHYLITAKTESDAKKSAMKYMEHFIDDDDDPEKIENGFTFYNKAVIVRLESTKERRRKNSRNFC